jgi:hypothetical protein
MRTVQILALAMVAAVLAFAVTPATPSASTKSTTKKKAPAKVVAKVAPPKTPPQKRYLSSSPTVGSTNGKTPPAKHATVARTVPPKPAVSKPAPPKPGVTQPTMPPSGPAKPATTAKRPPAKPVAPFPAKLRVQAHNAVYEHVATGADIPVENPAALIPFFEQLYRLQQGHASGPVRILHYGDSHSAADEWTGEMRARLQEKFGDGGS